MTGWHRHRAATARSGAQTLKPWQRRSLVATSALLLGSGAVWLGLHYLAGAGADTDALPHPFEAWLMRLHGLGAFAAVFMLGVLAAAHVPRGWRLAAHRRHAAQQPTGLVLCALGALLVASGYLLYYFTPPEWREGFGWAHALLGVVMLPIGLAHANHHRLQQRDRYA